jgi:hypothetical protein
VKILAGVAVIVIGVWLWMAHANAQNERRLGAVASELAGRPVGVRCQGFWAALVDIQSRTGEVEFPQGRAPDHMFLTRGVCTRLRHFEDAHSHRDLDCLAGVDWQRFAFSVDYDAPCPRGARADAEAINTLVHESMHEYRSSDCRAAAGLDLVPSTVAFPSESPPVLPPTSLRGPAA